MRHARAHGQQPVRARDARGSPADRSPRHGPSPRSAGARPAAAYIPTPADRRDADRTRRVASRRRGRRLGPVRRPVIRTATPRDNGAIAAIWNRAVLETLSLIHISEPTRLLSISYA